MTTPAPEWRILPDPDALAQAGAELISVVATAAIVARGRFTLALAGGSTPQALYTLLARPPYAARIDWERTIVAFGDERCVPPDHPQSNYRMAHTALLAHVPLPSAQILRMEGELAPAQAAERYEAALRAAFPDQPWPRFDLIVLGLGDDGHTASLFPGTAALHERERWVVANYVPQLATWRLTLTAPAINAASQIAFLVAGANKAQTLRAVAHGPYQPERLPAQAIRPQDGALTWLVDAAAAGQG